MTFKSDRQKKLQAASKKKGAETRAANVRAAGEQKRRALESGGRFSEGGTVTTVTFRGTSSTPLSGKERAQALFDKFSRGEFAKSDSEFSKFLESQGGSTIISRTQSETETDAFAFDEQGEVSAPPLKQKPLVSKEETQIDNLLGKNISFERLFKDPDIKQGFDTLVNFGRDVLHDPILLGGAATKPAIDLSKSIKAGRQETSIDLLSEGKFKEAFEKKGVVGSLAATAGLILSPLGGAKAAKEAPIALELIKRQKTISKLEKELILPSQSQKLPSGGKLTGIGEESVITGGGLEGGKQIPIFVTKFTSRGKPSTFEITPKPQGKPIITVKEATISGKLDPLSASRLNALKEGSFEVTPKITLTSKDLPATRFTARLGQDKSNITFKKGLEQGELLEFAIVKETKTGNILKGLGENIRKDVGKPPSVFVQSKAEKLIPDDLGSRNVGLSKTKFNTGELAITKGGAGQAGKAKVFSGQEVKLIKEKFTPTKQTPKQEQEILFSAPRFQDTQTTQGLQGGSIVTTQPPEPQKGGGSLLKIPQEQGLSVSIIEGTKKQDLALIPPITKQVITPKPIIPTTTTAPPFTIPGIIQTPKQEQIITTVPITGTPTFPEITIAPPPLTSSILKPPPVEPPIKIRIAVLPPPPLLSGDFDTPSKLLGSTKGFFGNVPQDALIGIVRKAPTITVSEKAGFFKRQFRQKKEPNILGGNIKIGLGSTKKQKGKKRKGSKKSGLDFLGSSKSVNPFGKSKGFKIRL